MMAALVEEQQTTVTVLIQIHIEANELFGTGA